MAIPFHTRGLPRRRTATAFGEVLLVAALGSALILSVVFTMAPQLVLVALPDVAAELLSVWVKP